MAIFSEVLSARVVRDGAGLGHIASLMHNSAKEFIIAQYRMAGEPVPSTAFSALDAALGALRAAEQAGTIDYSAPAEPKVVADFNAAVKGATVAASDKAREVIAAMKSKAVNLEERLAESAGEIKRLDTMQKKEVSAWSGDWDAADGWFAPKPPKTSNTSWHPQTILQYFANKYPLSEWGFTTTPGTPPYTTDVIEEARKICNAHLNDTITIISAEPADKRGQVLRWSLIPPTNTYGWVKVLDNDGAKALSGLKLLEVETKAELAKKADLATLPLKIKETVTAPGDAGKSIRDAIASNALLQDGVKAKISEDQAFKTDLTASIKSDAAFKAACKGDQGSPGAAGLSFSVITRGSVRNGKVEGGVNGKVEYELQVTQGALNVSENYAGRCRWHEYAKGAAEPKETDNPTASGVLKYNLSAHDNLVKLIVLDAPPA